MNGVFHDWLQPRGALMHNSGPCWVLLQLCCYRTSDDGGVRGSSGVRYTCSNVYSTIMPAGRCNQTSGGG